MNPDLAALLAERFPTLTEMRAEARRPVPPAPPTYRPPETKWRAHLTRLEQLLLQARAEEWRVRRGVASGVANLAESGYVEDMALPAAHVEGELA